jgi:hypothetical protein
VREILSERRAVLDDLARLLPQNESVPEDELRKMMSAATLGTASSSPVELSHVVVEN